MLRLINSPVMGMRKRVHSVLEALIAVGEDAFRRIATLAITRELNGGQPEELLRMAFVRARFCELAAQKSELDSTEQYLLGLLSLLPAMLRLPMESLAPDLPLSEKMHVALTGVSIPEGRLLEWVIAHEQGNWSACRIIATTYGPTEEVLVGCYESAVEWAESAQRFA